MVRLKTVRLSFLVFLLLARPALVPPEVLAVEPPSEPFGRSCLVVEEIPAPGSTHPKTTVFDERVKPGPGKRLALYLVASVNVPAVLAAFSDQDRRLTSDWRPQFVELKAWQEYRLPIPPTSWDWDQATEAFEVDVVFLGKRHEGSEAVKTLVAAMQDPGGDSRLLDLQTKKLRDLLSRWIHVDEPVAFHAGATPNAWGGTLRGAKFPWREHAQTVVLDEHGRGVLIYRYGD